MRESLRPEGGAGGRASLDAMVVLCQPQLLPRCGRVRVGSMHLTLFEPSPALSAVILLPYKVGSMTAHIVQGELEALRRSISCPESSGLSYARLLSCLCHPATALHGLASSAQHDGQKSRHFVSLLSSKVFGVWLLI